MSLKWRVKALNQTTWPVFAELVEHCDGFPSGCWCMAFHAEGVDRGPDHASLNRKRKMARVFEGTAHAALVFDEDACVGWCQFGPADELPRIKSRVAYDRSCTTPPDWRIACCYVAKGYRRQGVALAALEGAITMIAGLGGGVVEGYPEPVGSVPVGFLFNGALSTYERLGFNRDRIIGKHRWVVKRVVEAEA